MLDDGALLTAETDDIVISAGRELVEKNDAGHKFIWGYYFCIENNSDKRIRLLGKDWHITDDKGNSYSDDSKGFKGEIPDLEPGEYFEFTSTAPLSSPHAVFYGSCKIEADNDGVKDIRIPTFQMSVDEAYPHLVN